MQSITRAVIGQFLPQSNINALHIELFKNLTTVWAETSSLDAHDRCEKVVSSSISILTSGLVLNEGHHPTSMYSIATVETWRRRVRAALNEHYISFRTQFFEKQNTFEYLGQASKKIYSFVREDLGVPFHRGLVEHPVPGDDIIDGRPKKTIGSWVGIIYESLRDGRFYDKLMEALSEDLEGNTENGMCNGQQNVTFLKHKL
jgi:phenylalanine ammonia-lyase